MPHEPTTRQATCDPALSAVVTSRRPLRYATGADAALDRPAHVRAGSALAWAGRRLAVVQDDANFLALVDPASGAVQPVTLPAGHGGLRQFDDLRGNKRYKLDLEACARLRLPGGGDGGGGVLLAFGSGSLPARERVLVVREPDGPAPAATLIDCPALYARLRATPGFAGSELNVEGAAALAGGRLRLFQRGNGAARGGLLPVDATCDLDAAALLDYLEGRAAEPPPLERVVAWDLGAIDGVRLTFTDGAARPDGGAGACYLAAAEASPDAVRDGPVAGVALGVIDDATGRARWAPLREPDGALFLGKAEGLVFDPAAPGQAYVVLDRDDPAAPCELCTVALRGAW